MGPQTRSTAKCPTRCPAAAAWPGLTSDCLRVQSDIAALAELLSAPAFEDATALLHALRAARQARHDLREHVASIEGRGGLYEYLDESAPWLTPEIQCLSSQHHEMESGLENLEAALNAYDPEQPQSVQSLQRCAQQVLEILHRHQACARHLQDDVSTPGPEQRQPGA